MSDKNSDPIAIWQTMLGEMGKGLNTFANQAMSSPEFGKAVDQAGLASAGVQQQVGDLMERYLASLNMPSRAQMTAFDERLQAIEGKLEEITALLRDLKQASARPDPAAPVQKPPRTKQPPPKAAKSN